MEKIQYQDLCNGIAEESSKEIQKRIIRTREIQEKRYQGMEIATNGQLNVKQMEEHCRLGCEEKRLMEHAFQNMEMTARTYYKVLGVARTIADLEEEAEIKMHHLKEALGYRMIDKKYWGGQKNEI